MLIKERSTKEAKEGKLAYTVVLKNNATKTIDSQKKKKTWDTFEITYYNYNKKSHFVSDYTKYKAKKKLLSW